LVDKKQTTTIVNEMADGDTGGWSLEWKNKWEQGKILVLFFWTELLSRILINEDVWRWY